MSENFSAKGGNLCNVECKQHTPVTQISNVYETECDLIYIKPNYICALCSTMPCNISPELELGEYFIIAGVFLYYNFVIAIFFLLLLHDGDNKRGKRTCCNEAEGKYFTKRTLIWLYADHDHHLQSLLCFIHKKVLTALNWKINVN